MSDLPIQLIASGFSSKVIGFSLSFSQEPSSVSFKQKIFHDDNLESNHSFMVANSNLPGVFYAVHEIEEIDGKPTGAVSRWKLGEDGSFERKQVLNKDFLIM